MTKKKTRLKFLLKNKTLMKTICFKLFGKERKQNTYSFDYQNYLAKYIFNYKYDCTNPRSFNEYLGWIKFFYRNNLWERCADKIKAKDFLIENGFLDYVPATLGKYKDVGEIDLDKLPNRFVLKTNHDCGSVFICDKTKTDFDRVFKELSKSLKHSYSNDNGEWVYENIKPIIFAEELLEPDEGEQLVDYKLFSFNGIVGFGFVAQDRNSDCRFTLIDRNFGYINSDYIYLRPNKNAYPKRPHDFDLMVEIAESIGKILNFARIDFYQTKKGPKIGEITFFSQTGLGPFTNSRYDFIFGDYFRYTIFPDLIREKRDKLYENCF